MVIGERFEHVQDAFGAVSNELQLDFGLLYGLFNLPFLGSSVVLGGERVDNGVIQIEDGFFGRFRLRCCMNACESSFHFRHQVIL